MGDALPSIDLSPEMLTQITSASDVSCAIGNGNVYCWGIGDFGVFGQGNTRTIGLEPNDMGANLSSVPLGGATAGQVETSSSFTCARWVDGTVVCWGDNDLGQLGLEHRDKIGDDESVVLDGVDLDGEAVSIATGEQFACALLLGGAVKCWGANWYGQLGQGDNFSRGDSANSMGADLPPLDFGSDHVAKSICAGAPHACAILDDGAVKCWGSNESGQLGIGVSYNVGDGSSVDLAVSATVDLGTGAEATAASCGSEHTCAILADESIKCWGGNTLGQLGQLDVVSRGQSPFDLGDNLSPVVLE